MIAKFYHSFILGREWPEKGGSVSGCPSRSLHLTWMIANCGR